MIKFKNIFIFLIFIFSFTVFSNENIHKNKVVGIVNNFPYTKLGIDRYETLVDFLLDLGDIVNVYKFVLEDALVSAIQIDEANELKIKYTKDEGLSGHCKYGLEVKLEFNDYQKFLYQNDFQVFDVLDFLHSTLRIDKLHDKKIMSDLTVSAKEIYDYLNYSNSHNVKYLFYSYFVLKVKFYKSKFNESNVKIARHIFNIMKKENEIEILIDYGKKKNINIYFKFLKIDPEISSNKSVQKYIEKNIDKKLIGPLCNKKRIIFLKVIKRESKIAETDINFRAQHFFIKKNLVIEDNVDFDLKNYNMYKLFQIANNFDRKAMIDSLKKYYRFEYLNKNDLNQEMYYAVKNLNKDELTSILEFNDGWHIFKFASKEYSVGSFAYQNLSAAILNRKINIARKRYMKDLYSRTLILIP